MAHTQSRKPRSRSRAIVKLFSLLALIVGGKYFLPENPLLWSPPTSSKPTAVAVPVREFFPNAQDSNHHQDRQAVDQKLLFVSLSGRQAQH